MANEKGTALITGASLGLGREFARLFAADGHDVVLVARNEAKLKELAAELEKAHSIKAHVIAADLSDAASSPRVYSAVKENGLEIEYLVNNAGFGTNGRFIDQDAARELEMVSVNISALMHLTRLFVPDMVKRGHGRVLNIASTAGFLPGPFMATYYATKAFVISFSEAVAYELQGTGVTVTAHCPGATETEFARTAGSDKSALFKSGVAGAAATARHGYRAMMAGKTVAIHGWANWFKIQSVRFGPRRLLAGVAAGLNGK